MRAMTSCNNPSGIMINDGYYALLGALMGLSVDEALHKICGIKVGGDQRKNNRHKGLGKKEKILELYRNFPNMHNSEIARIVDCSREMVRYVLKEHGVPKRNRWDGYISLNKRYSKKKRGA